MLAYLLAYLLACLLAYLLTCLLACLPACCIHLYLLMYLFATYMCMPEVGNKNDTGPKVSYAFCAALRSGVIMDVIGIVRIC